MLDACDVANITIEAEHPLTLHHLKEDDLNEVVSIDLLTSDLNRFKHEVRHSLRCELWDNLRRRRQQFEGAPNGFDRKLSMHLYKSRKLTGLARYQLRVILAGAVASMKRLSQNNAEMSSECPCCHSAVETVEHIFCECPAHDAPRSADLRPDYFAALPPCMRLHGPVPVDFQSPPDRSETPYDRLDLVYRLQYTLISILENRAQYLDQALAPRW